MTDLNFEIISCPICGCDKTTRFFETKDYSYNNEGPFYIVKCKSCSFIYQNPRPKFEDLWIFYPRGEYFTAPYEGEKVTQNQLEIIINSNRNFFSKIARSILEVRYGYPFKNSEYYLSIGKFLNFTIGSLLVNLTYFQRPYYVNDGKLLEVGFGTCADLIQFRKEGWLTYGADVDEDCCNYAKEKFNFNILAIDQYRINAETEFFDVIYLSQTLEHLSFLNESLTEFKRLLKKDGQLIMKFPNINCLQAKFWKSKWRGVEAPRHLSYFSKKSVKILLQKNGFSDIEIRTVNLSPYDIFCSNIPPTIKNNEKYSSYWWNNKVLSTFLQLFAPFFGLGESIYVTARK